jgi:hypothetical protein
MDLENIVCICHQKFNKEEFKKHHKNCKAFKNKFHDFDLRIANLLKEYLSVKENSSIIKFLFQRYIKLIDHKFKAPNFANINRIRKKRKNNFSPSVLKEKKEIQVNLGLKNKSLCQELYGSDDEINDDEFLNRLSFKGYNQNNYISQQNNDINAYQQNNNINRYQQNNNINLYGNSCLRYQPNSNDMIRSSPFQYNNLINIQNLQFNNFGQDINKSLSFNFRQYSNSFDQGYCSNNDIYSLISKNSNNNIGGNQNNFKIGSKLGDEEKAVIINFCRDEYKKYGGKCNCKMIETIGKHINKVYSEHNWFILIYNNEYSDIQYNLSQTIPERYMIFSLGKLIFHFKEYK